MIYSNEQLCWPGYRGGVAGRADGVVWRRKADRGVAWTCRRAVVTNSKTIHAKRSRVRALARHGRVSGEHYNAGGGAADWRENSEREDNLTARKDNIIRKLLR